jgi:SAM-dependent methyltransferase
MTADNATAYDRMAAIYDLWVASRRQDLDEIRDFYLPHLLAAPGPAVELGVGNGRLLIAAAQAGKPVIGVDSSAAMLALARRHAEEAGIADRILLLQADFRDFVLPQPASLIALPYDSVGHLLAAEDKRGCLRQVFSQLAPGGRFVLDYDVFDPVHAERYERRPFLHFVENAETGPPMRMIWLTAILNREQRTRQVHLWLEEIAADGATSRHWVGMVENSWLRDAEEMRDLLTEAGFEIEACLGSFDGAPLTQSSERNIWIARRPG